MFSLKLFNGNYEKKGSKNMVPIRNQAICASSTKLRILAVYPAPCRSSEFIYIYIYISNGVKQGGLLSPLLFSIY